MITKENILFITLFFLWGHCYAENYHLTDNLCIQSEVKNDLLFVYNSDCKKNKYLLEKFQVPNDIPKINFIFHTRINNKKYVFLSVSYSENYRDYNGEINYTDGYHLINVYECDRKCIFNKEISNFFGSGGSLFNIKTNEIVYNFPYLDEMSIKNELSSKLFSHWFYEKDKAGEILKKTYMKYENNFSYNNIGYLVKGDKFTINDVSSRWLNISYISKNNKIITGWIRCEDTNICNEY
ncbi:hypothetical protein [Acinetobacter rudis]|uniref:hypothetical protein n=1 Tax=Acinetobacter rudis TaxID=632955 RepID=UPI00333FDFEC